MDQLTGRALQVATMRGGAYADVPVRRLDDGGVPGSCAGPAPGTTSLALTRGAGH